MFDKVAQIFVYNGGNMKSKYNTGEPIDINELTEEERKLAFHEWAEGSEALEQLLNEGYQKGFLSHACCGGDTGRPYICYNLDNDYSRKMAMAVAEKLVNSDLDCKVDFTSDFVYTEEEYKDIREHLLKTFPEDFSKENMPDSRCITEMNVQTKMENREEVFGAMSKSIREAELDKVKLPQSEADIPKKEFKKIKEEVQDDITTKSEDKFIADLKSKTYTQKEITRNDVKAMESPAVEEPIAQVPITQGPEII